MGDGDHFGARGEVARFRGGPVTFDSIERLRKLEAHIALHPYGECTCGGEGECGWCQRSDALERVPKLEAEGAELRKQLAILTTAMYVNDQSDIENGPLCPECHETIMYMPNDCETCRKIGAHVTKESVEEYCKAVEVDVPETY